MLLSVTIRHRDALASLQGGSYHSADRVMGRGEAGDIDGGCCAVSGISLVI